MNGLNVNHIRLQYQHKSTRNLHKMHAAMQDLRGTSACVFPPTWKNSTQDANQVN